jgi:hypothetical protein
MPVPDFAPGEVLTAAAMDSIGLWLVKTQTVGAGVASVTVTGAFSADYQNYKIIYTGGTHSAANDIQLQLGATTTGYYGARISLFYSSDTFNFARNNNSASFGFAGTGSSTGAYCNFDLLNPFATTRTIINAPNIANTSTAAVAGSYNGFLDDATSYTAFTFIATSGTLTGGTIRVYGYRN